MIRLAVCAPDALSCELAARLHDVTVEPFSAEVPSTCTAVAVLDPPPDVLEWTDRWLGSGRDVLLLPGSWLSRAALDRLSATADASGAQLAVLNPERFRPSRRLMQEQLDSGRLGQPGLVRLHHWEHSTGTPDDLPHSLLRDLDVVHSLMDAPLDVVYARELHPSAPAGRCVQLHLGFTGGGMALVDYVEGLPTRAGYQFLSLIGSSGAAYADDHQNTQLVFGAGRQPQAAIVDEGSTALAPLVQFFVSGLIHGQHFDASLASWRAVLATADVATQSLTSGQAIRLVAN